MSDDHVGYLCPYCRTRYLETIATLPYVRGFLLAYQFGSKKIVGCRKCVRIQLLKETGISSLTGWFSPTALIANPFLIVYGLGRSAFVSTNTEGVRQQLKEAGIPEPQQELKLVNIAYGLAAAMIAADKKIKPEEIEAAAAIGAQLFDDFRESEFREVVSNHQNLPEAAELAAVLSEILTNEGKVATSQYLLAIAAADGEIASEEQKLLDEVTMNLRIDDSEGASQQTA